MSEPKTFTDKSGKWIIDGKADILIEPSEEWLQKRNDSNNNPEPSQEDMDKANREIEMLNILMEVGLL